MGVDETNEWTESYFMQFSIDSFIMETIVNYIKLYFVRRELMKGENSIFSKIFGDDDIIKYFNKQKK